MLGLNVGFRFAIPVILARPAKTVSRQNNIVRTTRRETLALLAALPLASSPFLTGCSPRPAPNSVVVLGAGIAGLAAAKALAAAGAQVTVLEGRDRTGGRIHTVKTNGRPVDLGASWLYGSDDNPIAKIAKQANAPTVPSSESQTFVQDAKALTPAQTAGSALVLDPFELLAGLTQAESGRSVQDRLDAHFAKTNFQPTTHRQILAAIRSGIVNELAADLADLDPVHFAEGTTPQGPDLLFPQGYQAITDFLAQGLDIRLGKTVDRILASPRGCTVTAQGREFRAAAVVIALPHAVLASGSVEFLPALPGPHLDAFGRVRTGFLEKTILFYPTQFWPEGWITPVPPLQKTSTSAYSEFFDLTPLTGQPAVCAFAGGADAVNSLPEDPAARTRLAHSAFIELFPEARRNNPAEPAADANSDWANDPFAKGAYSYLAPGARPEDRKTLASPAHVRLFFAGEHTSVEHPATVQGAYLSGLRAAEEALDYLDSKS